MALIHALVEGEIDAAVATRLIEYTGHAAGPVYGRRGVGYIKNKIGGFNQSAQGIRYLALVDLMDTGMECAPAVVDYWLPRPEMGMQFRVVVREIESWLMADVDGLADLLGVSRARFVADPEMLPDPKQALVNLATHSRRRAIRSAIVPEAGTSSIVGPAYNVEMRAFVEDRWSPERARVRSNSLTRCIDRLMAIGKL